MKKTEKPQRNFVAYEYKEVSANSSQASFLLDGYENFGWEPDDNLPQSSQSRHPGAEKMMTLRLKRDRKIVNKTELTSCSETLKPVSGKFSRWKTVRHRKRQYGRWQQE